MANIGTISAKIVADASGFLKGMNDVKKAAAAGVGSVRKTILGDNMISRFAGEAKGALSAIPFIGGALGAIPTSGSAFIDWIKEGLKEVKEMDVSAKRLGVTFDEFAAMSRITGGEVEGFAAAIAKMQKNLGKVRGEADDANSSFTAIGLNVSELKGMGTLQQFGMIADQLNKFAVQSERAYFASDIFGKSWKITSEAMSKGSEGIDKVVKAQTKLQGGITPQDIANTRAALKAIKDIEDSVIGIKRQVAVAAAPFITTLATEFKRLTENGVDFKKITADGFEFLAKVLVGFLGLLAKAADMLERFRKNAPEMLGGDPAARSKKIDPNAWMLGGFLSDKEIETANKQHENFLKDQEEFGKKLAEELKKPEYAKIKSPIVRETMARGAVSEMMDLGGGTNGIFGKLSDEFLKASDAFRKLMTGKPPDDAGKDFFALTEDEKALNDAAVHLREELTKQVATLGMNAAAVQRWELEQKGATAAMLEDIKARQDFTAISKLNVEAQSPLINFWKEVDFLLDSVGISGHGAELGIQRAVDSLTQFAKISETKLPTADFAGTAGALSRIAAFERGGTARNLDDILKQALTVHKQNLVKASETAANTKAIRDNLKGANLPK